MAPLNSFGVVVESLLAEGWRVRFRARGRSMLPTVRDGECLTVSPARARDIARGDVVLCATWRGHVAHRVLAVEGVGADEPVRFRLRGDAAWEDDRVVTGSQLRGLVTSVERDGRARRLAFRGGRVGLWLHAAKVRAVPALRLARAWLAPRPAPARL